MNERIIEGKRKVVVKESLVVRYLGDERGVRVGMMRAGRHARLRRLGGHPRSRATRRADRRRSSSLLQLARTVLLLQAETLSHKGEKAMHPRRESLWTHSWNSTLAGTIYIYILALLTWNKVFLMVEDRSEKERRLAGGSSLRAFKTKPPRPSSSRLSRSAAGSAPAPPPAADDEAAAP